MTVEQLSTNVFALADVNLATNRAISVMFSSFERNRSPRDQIIRIDSVPALKILSCPPHELLDPSTVSEFVPI